MPGECCGETLASTSEHEHLPDGEHDYADDAGSR
jgi:hypothetical protein